MRFLHYTAGMPIGSQPPSPIDKARGSEPNIDMEAFWTEIEALVSVRQAEHDKFEIFKSQLQDKHKNMTDEEINEVASKQWQDEYGKWSNMMEFATVENPRKNFTRVDAVMWYKARKFMEGSVSREEIQADLRAYVKDIEATGKNNDRISLLQVVANMIQGKEDYF